MNAVIDHNKVFHMRNVRDGEPAQRVHIATFHGNAFSAERDADSGDLRVYHVSGSGEPVPMSTIGDKIRTADTRMPQRLPPPRTSITLEQMLANAAKARADLARCQCKR